MSVKISIEDELKKFFANAEELLSQPEKNEDECYVILYHIKLISGSLKENDYNVASLLSTWMVENKEKFRFCATDDDFYKLTREIEENIGEVMDAEKPIQREINFNLGRYLQVLNKPDPFKKKT